MSPQTEPPVGEGLTRWNPRRSRRGGGQRKGSLEFVSFWPGKGACRLKAALSKTSIEYSSNRIVLKIGPHGSLKGSAEVVLMAGRGFANTIKRTISEERNRKAGEKCGLINASMK